MFSTESEVAFNRYGESHPASDLDPQEMRRLLAAYDHLLDRHMPPSILVDEFWNLVDTFGDAAQYMRLRSRRPTKCLLELVNEPLKEFLIDSRRRLQQGEHSICHALHLSGDHDTSGRSLTQVRITQVPLGLEDRIYFLIRFEHLTAGPVYHSPFSGYPPADAVSPQYVCEPVAPEFESTSLSNVSTTALSDAAVLGGAAHGVSVPFGPGQPLHEFAIKTRLAVIFIDLELRIRYFSPRAAEKFNLVPHDVGRRLQTFSGGLELSDLIDRINAVIHTGDRDQMEVGLPKQERYYILRIAPDFCGETIQGVILTAIDLTSIDARHQQQQLLSQVVLSTNDAVVGRDRENRITIWNAAAEELFGYSPAEAIGQSASLIVPEGHEMEHCQALRMLQKGGYLEHFESIRRTKDGRLLSVSVRMSPIYDDEHRLIGMSTIERDVSMLRESQQRLVHNERKLYEFYHQSPDLCCTIDLTNDTIVECNDRLCDQLGFDRRDIIGRHVWELSAPENKAAAFDLLAKLHQDQRVEDGEMDLRRCNGGTMPVSLFAQTYCDPASGLNQARLIWRDMSSIRAREADARESESRYRMSFQNSAIGIAHLDLNGCYTEANKRMCDIVGYSAQELKGLPIDQISHPDDALNQVTLSNLFRSGETTFHLQKRYIHKSGKEIWASVAVTLERDLSGKPVAYHLYVEDISERKELENELRHAISQRDQFLAMLSHELRNPLGAILNTCNLLSRKSQLPKRMHQPISIVSRQARQMAELLDDLLDVSRITSGKIKLEKTRTLLADIVDEAIESQQGLAQQRQQRLLVTYADEPLHVYGDHSRLVQVVVNLLNNAIKYSGEGREIKVALEKRGRFGVIRVKDQGVGIEPELIESLFEMFAQKDSTLDRSSGGMGLGLHLVRKLVEFHNGKVIGRSEGVGRGSEFIVRLPLVKRVVKQKGAPQVERCTPSPALLIRKPIQSIAVVEDIADARNMLVALLQADDYQVQSAEDGLAGLQLILASRPDLAIVDIGLPKMDGFEVARRVRQQVPKSELTMVALSGYGQESDQEKALAAGFDFHLVKPLNHARLEAILARGKG